MQENTNTSTLRPTAGTSLGGKLRNAPRLMAALTIGGGAAVLGLMLLLIGSQGGRVRLTTRGQALIGIAGLLMGFGLGQLLWPPRKPEPGEQASGWKRGTLAQKIVWCAAAAVGVVAAAIIGTSATGNI